MPISIKTPDEISKMRIAGRLAASVLEMIEPHVVPGITTDELNQICHDYIVANDAYPAPLNYQGFPKSICTSINQVVCHGIPDGKALKKGDIVNIDITVIKDEYHGDTSKTFFVGGESAASILAKRLVKITQEAMIIGIKLVKPGRPLDDIGTAIQKYVEAQDFTIVREYCGHGIGKVFHEPELQVLHYHDPRTKIILEEGMTFTIEPMVNAGKRDIKLLGDQWTVVTKDRMLSAQWEHTIAVTSDGYEVLTRRNEEIW
jgi:methionyl aminopeptidase